MWRPFGRGKKHTALPDPFVPKGGITNETEARKAATNADILADQSSASHHDAIRTKEMIEKDINKGNYGAIEGLSNRLHGDQKLAYGTSVAARKLDAKIGKYDSVVPPSERVSVGGLGVSHEPTQTHEPGHPVNTELHKIPSHITPANAEAVIAAEKNNIITLADEGQAIQIKSATERLEQAEKLNRRHDIEPRALTGGVSVTGHTPVDPGNPGTGGVSVTGHTTPAGPVHDQTPTHHDPDHPTPLPTGGVGIGTHDPLVSGHDPAGPGHDQPPTHHDPDHPASPPTGGVGLNPHPDTPASPPTGGVGLDPHPSTVPTPAGPGHDQPPTHHDPDHPASPPTGGVGLNPAPSSSVYKVPSDHDPKGDTVAIKPKIDSPGGGSVGDPSVTPGTVGSVHGDKDSNNPFKTRHPKDRA